MILKAIKSFGPALRGLSIMKMENNAHIHLAATILVVATGCYLGIERWEWLWICWSIAIVWIAEIFNTAIEKIVDFISPDYHPMAGKIKDLAAGAVLIAALLSCITGAIIFMPYIV